MVYSVKVTDRRQEDDNPAPGMILIIFHTFFKDVNEVIFLNYFHAIIADPLHKGITMPSLSVTSTSYLQLTLSNGGKVTTEILANMQY